jgi:hypothetical protein
LDQKLSAFVLLRAGPKYRLTLAIQLNDIVERRPLISLIGPIVFRAAGNIVSLLFLVPCSLRKPALTPVTAKLVLPVRINEAIASLINHSADPIGVGA